MLYLVEGKGRPYVCRVGLAARKMEQNKSIARGQRNAAEGHEHVGSHNTMYNVAQDMLLRGS